MWGWGKYEGYSEGNALYLIMLAHDIRGADLYGMQTPVYCW